MQNCTNKLLMEVVGVVSALCKTGYAGESGEILFWNPDRQHRANLPVDRHLQPIRSVRFRLLECIPFGGRRHCSHLCKTLCQFIWVLESLLWDTAKVTSITTQSSTVAAGQASSALASWVSNASVLSASQENSMMLSRVTCALFRTSVWHMRPQFASQSRIHLHTNLD